MMIICYIKLQQLSRGRAKTQQIPQTTEAAAAVLFFLLLC